MKSQAAACANGLGSLLVGFSLPCSSMASAIIGLGIPNCLPISSILLCIGLSISVLYILSSIVFLEFTSFGLTFMATIAFVFGNLLMK